MLENRHGNQHAALHKPWRRSSAKGDGGGGGADNDSNHHYPLQKFHLAARDEPPLGTGDVRRRMKDKDGTTPSFATVISPACAARKRVGRQDGVTAVSATGREHPR